jgi:hypothetical protein
LHRGGILGINFTNGPAYDITRPYLATTRSRCVASHYITFSFSVFTA